MKLSENQNKQTFEKNFHSTANAIIFFVKVSVVAINYLKAIHCVTLVFSCLIVTAEKYEKDAKKYWDLFYKRHQDRVSSLLLFFIVSFFVSFKLFSIARTKLAL